MSEHAAAVRENRELTSEEMRLLRWMLEHGSAESAKLVDQIALLRVISRCPCGCASIDFSFNGDEPVDGQMRVIADFLYGDASSLCGAFVFEKQGIVAGLEVYGLAVEHPRSLPEPSDLRPFEAEVEGAGRA